MAQPQNQRTLILASTSSYRSLALKSLQIPFTSIDPEADESALTHEKPDDLALRLAHSKAQAVALQHPTSVVIGSDQVGYCNHRRLHKPGSTDNAIAQLQKCSGRMATFYTAVAVHDNNQRLSTIVSTELHFRDLSRMEIEHYVRAEPALDCAGGFKAEGLGICLFEEVTSKDPSALVGLPMIATIQFLRQCGIDVLNQPLASH